MTRIVLDPSFYEPIAVLLPTSAGSGLLHATIEPGSGIVAVGAGDGERQLVYYQKLSQMTGGTYADRVAIAHGRAWSDQLKPGCSGTPSTHQMLAAPRKAIQPIGTYDPREGEITLHDEHARVLLTAWLEGAGERDDPDTLATALLSTSVKHQTRRDLRRALAVPGPHHPHLARFARKHGHEDLLVPRPR